MQVTALFSEGLRINLLEPYGAVRTVDYRVPVWHLAA